MFPRSTPAHPPCLLPPDQAQLQAQQEQQQRQREEAEQASDEEEGYRQQQQELQSALQVGVLFVACERSSAPTVRTAGVATATGARPRLTRALGWFRCHPAVDALQRDSTCATCV